MVDGDAFGNPTAWVVLTKTRKSNSQTLLTCGGWGCIWKSEVEVVPTLCIGSFDKNTYVQQAETFNVWWIGTHLKIGNGEEGEGRKKGRKDVERWDGECKGKRKGRKKGKMRENEAGEKKGD